MASDSSLALDIKDLITDLTSKKAFGQLDLGDVFGLNTTSNNKVVGNSDLGDFFSGLSKVNFSDIKLDKIDFGSFLDGVGSFFSNVTGKDFKVDQLFSDLGNVDLLQGITLGSLFKGLSDTAFPMFTGVKADQFIQVIDAFDAVDNSGNVDLLGGMGSVLNALTSSGLLQDFVVNNLLFGGVGGVAGTVLKGFASNDFMRGGESIDKLLGQAGDDLLNGGGGSDLLRGLVGDDVLAGLLGDDVLDGGRGSDTIVGGQGIDKLSGGKGNDRFVLETNGGNDIIKDFKNTFDRLVVLGNVDFNDLDISQKNGSTIISAGNQKIATLEGVKSTLIGAADFIFS
jgi:RTX calcium-binding nonapeptide repeat (4 copies)